MVAGCYSLLRFALHPPKAAAGGLGRPGGLSAPGLRAQAGSGRGPGPLRWAWAEGGGAVARLELTKKGLCDLESKCARELGRDAIFAAHPLPALGLADTATPPPTEGGPNPAPI